MRLRYRAQALADIDGIYRYLAKRSPSGAHIGAIDPILGSLGYEGDLDAQMPRQKREVIFGRGELTRAILDELRGATGPMTSREIAQGIVAVSGQDARDRRYVFELTKRVGKALRSHRDDDLVRSAVDTRGNVQWSLRRLRQPLGPYPSVRKQ